MAHHGHATPKKDVRIEATNDLEKSLMDRFELFDHSGKQAVEAKDVGIIIRSLGCCPTEAEIQEVTLLLESKEVPGIVPLANFLPYMVKAMCEHKFYPASAENLLVAFKYFDKDGHGYLTTERFRELMMEEGEPFTKEEFDELLLTALDPVTGTITYEYYINQLVIVPKDVYDIADVMEAERLRVEAAAPKKRNILEMVG